MDFAGDTVCDHVRAIRLCRPRTAWDTTYCDPIDADRPHISVRERERYRTTRGKGGNRWIAAFDQCPDSTPKSIHGLVSTGPSRRSPHIFDQRESCGDDSECENDGQDVSDYSHAAMRSRRPESPFFEFGVCSRPTRLGALVDIVGSESRGRT